MGEETSGPPAAVPLEKIDWVIGSDLVYSGVDEIKLVIAFACILQNPRAREGLKALILLCDRPCSCHGCVRAVDRFLQACDACELQTYEIQLPPELILEATGNKKLDG